jgi:hypothetical protein
MNLGELPLEIVAESPGAKEGNGPG